MPVATSSPSEITRNTSFLAGAAVYWHLLSLDAPTVAALWSWSFARAAHVELPILAPLLLAAGTWLVYVADRILDGASRAKYDGLQLRHHFYCSIEDHFFTQERQFARYSHGQYSPSCLLSRERKTRQSSHLPLFIFYWSTYAVRA
ncbi:MAG TPA: hypothetical protein VHT24_02975 [Pseudacidobacterium sp.]|nr:hypothetical protein [Pseudacidobacterium sp.]